MATGAADGYLFRCIYEGCISSADTGIERRPYHRNCSCALHNKSRGKSFSINSKNNAMSPRCNNISYPMRRSWSEGCLAVASSNYSSPSSSPAQSICRSNLRFLTSICQEEEEEED